MEEVGEGSRTVSVWVVWKDARAGKGEEGLVGGGGVVVVVVVVVVVGGQPGLG